MEPQTFEEIIADFQKEADTAKELIINAGQSPNGDPHTWPKEVWPHIEASADASRRAREAYPDEWSDWLVDMIIQVMTQEQASRN